MSELYAQSGEQRRAELTDSIVIDSGVIDTGAVSARSAPNQSPVRQDPGATPHLATTSDPINAETTAQQALEFLKNQAVTFVDGGISITSAVNVGKKHPSVLLQMDGNIEVLMHAGNTYVIMATGDLRQMTVGAKIELGHAYHSTTTGQPLGQPRSIKED